MDSCAFPLSVSALAVAIANQLTDDELDMASVLFVQLGDTLATIAVQRYICKKKLDAASIPEELPAENKPENPYIVTEKILSSKHKKSE